jgi:LPS export ABC transporter protein LptC
MTSRKALGFAALLLAAAGSWYLAGSLEEPIEVTPSQRRSGQGFYLRSVRILGTDEQGDMLYELKAEYAEQRPNREIAFENVEIVYSSDATVPWTLNADSAVIGSDQRRLILSGHVRAVNAEGLNGEVTEIRTPHLEFEPDNFRAETDSRVQIRIGSRSLTATGMLALLQEDRLQLKSNVSGKFVP